MTWHQQAACLGSDTDLFFPVGTTGSAIVQANRAKQVCAACPVRAACLDWAVRLHIDYGIWGGLSEEERRSWKRRETRNRSLQPSGEPVVAAVA